MIYNMIRRLLCWFVLGVTRLSSGTEVRTEDGRNKQLETLVLVSVVSVVTATSGHSAPAATAPVDEGTTARKGGKRKKAKNEMTIIIINYDPLFHGFAPSLKCLFCFKHDIDI